MVASGVKMIVGGGGAGDRESTVISGRGGACAAGAGATNMGIIFGTFLNFTTFSFHHKWNKARLLAINMVYKSCLTSCWMT